jgi:hypothetical protein
MDGLPSFSQVGASFTENGYKFDVAATSYNPNGTVQVGAPIACGPQTLHHERHPGFVRYLCYPYSVPN